MQLMLTIELAMFPIGHPTENFGDYRNAQETVSETEGCDRQTSRLIHIYCLCFCVCIYFCATIAQRTDTDLHNVLHVQHHIKRIINCLSTFSLTAEMLTSTLTMA